MAYYHPLLVHFAVALLAVGVLFRALSLAGRPAFLAPAALTLLLMGTVAAGLSVRSGNEAEGPSERVPGVRAAVVEHEEWGIRTRNVFYGVMLLEAIGLAFRKSPRQRLVYTASTAVGLAGLLCLYQAGAYGGRLVYGYAGGVGMRSGDPADVERLLLAGLYNEGVAERKAGRATEAATLLALAGERYPSDPEVQLIAAESLLIDRKNPRGALDKLRGISLAADNRMLRIRHGLLTADALVAAGERQGAAAVIQGLVTEYPTVPRLKQRLDALK